MLLILDLDETLIHARNELLEHEPHFRVGPYGVYKRPYLDEFLSFCRENFDVAVWTSSSEDYAGEVVENIFGKEHTLSFVWARNRCTIEYLPEQQTHIWSKNIKKVKEKGYALENVIAIDDTPEKYKRSYGNLVTVQPFEGDVDDGELKLLVPYLRSLRSSQNVRRVEKRFWRSMYL